MIFEKRASFLGNPVPNPYCVAGIELTAVIFIVAGEGDASQVGGGRAQDCPRVPRPRRGLHLSDLSPTLDQELIVSWRWDSWETNYSVRSSKQSVRRPIIQFGDQPRCYYFMIIY